MNPPNRSMLSFVVAGALGAAAFALSSEASAADLFHYQDRSGRVHLVDFAASPVSSSDTSSRTRASSVVDATERSNVASLTIGGAANESVSPRVSGSRGSARPPVAPALETNPAAIPYLSIVQEAASMFALPPELILAVIRVESNFNPRAVSKKGAMGLMQLMPNTASSLGVSDPFDPRQNIMGGARYLRSLVNDFDGEVSLALAGYNAGAGAVKRSGGIPGNAETQGYVPLVMVIYRTYAASGVARTAGM